MSHLDTQELPVQRIGPYTIGESPISLEITFKDSLGAVLNLNGYTAKISITKADGSGDVVSAGTATVSDAPNGKTNYDWGDADVATAGHFRLQMWVNNATSGVTLASDLFEYFVRAGTTKPTF